MPTNSSASTHKNSVEPRRAHAPSTTVLLVEDEYAIREFVRVVLEHAGYGVVTATDGEHGFTEYAADPDRFALVLSDVIMPNRTGPELVGLIRQIRPDVPVIFMSAYTGGLGPTPIEMPAKVTLLEKPFSLDQLLHAVAQTISENSRTG
jgi:two-component system, cell cycle response regulator CpdR